MLSSTYLPVLDYGREEEDAQARMRQLSEHRVAKLSQHIVNGPGCSSAASVSVLRNLTHVCLTPLALSATPARRRQGRATTTCTTAGSELGRPICREPSS